MHARAPARTMTGCGRACSEDDMAVRAVRVAVVVVMVGALLAVPGTAHADTTITSCSDTALRTALEQDGVVTFGLSCFSLQLVDALVVPAGRTIDLRSGGFTV